MAVDVVGPTRANEAELTRFVGELRAGITLLDERPDTFEAAPITPLSERDRSELRTDLATLRIARAGGKTIDQIMREHPDAIQVLKRYGVRTTMHVAREPGGYWSHHQRETAERVLGKRVVRLCQSLGALSEYAEARPPTRRRGEKLSRQEKRQQKLTAQRKMTVVAVRAFCAPVAIRLDDPIVTEAKIARRGPRKGEVVEGTIGVEKATYYTAPEKARLFAGTVQACMRSARAETLFPVYMEGRGMVGVEVDNATEFTNRAVGSVLWHMVQQELQRLGFVPPRDKRSPADSTETFHPALEALQNDLGWAYQHMPTAIYRLNRFVRTVAKDPGLLIQEASHAFQAARDGLRELIEEVRGDSQHNAEHHKFIRLLFEGKDRLRRRKAKLGVAQLGPENIRGRNPHEVVIDYASEFGARFKADPIGMLAEFFASVPKGVQDLFMSAIKLIPKVGFGIWWLSRDAFTWVKQKRAARKDTTVDGVISSIEQFLSLET